MVYPQFVYYIADNTKPMSSDLQMIHKVTLKLQQTLQEINKMLSEHLKSNNDSSVTQTNGVTKTSEAKKKKSKNNRIKRPISAFFIFSIQQRENIQRQYPDMAITQVSSNLGKIWGKLNDDEKKPYFDRAKKSLDRFFEQHPEERSKRSKKNKE